MRFNPALIFVLFFIVTRVQAQRGFGQNKLKNTTETIFGVGTANYLGELGGMSRKGSHRSPVDMELRATRLSLMFARRKYLGMYTACRYNVVMAWLGGNDQYTHEPYRMNRNLHFKSMILEASAVLEIGYTRMQHGERYLSRVKGVKNKNSYRYLFAGIGVFAFNPKGSYQGRWYALQPLGTEGQGMDGRKKYSRLSVSIPVGVGIKTKFMQRYFIGVEAGYRFTFTDYLDDVSTVYFDREQIRQKTGTVAAHFADPNLNNVENSTAIGSQRGNALQNDGYFILSLTLSKVSQKKKKGLF